MLALLATATEKKLAGLAGSGDDEKQLELGTFRIALANP